MADEQNQRWRPPEEGTTIECDLSRLPDQSGHDRGAGAGSAINYRDCRITMKITLERNATMPISQTTGWLTVRVESGHIQLRALGRVFDLREESLIALTRRTPHQFLALTPSTLVVTVAWTNEPSS